MSGVELEPLTNHLLLVLEPEPEKSKTIVLANQLEGLARFGKITAIGPEVRDLKVGMRVLASITAGVEVQAGVVMIAEGAVLGITHL
jgi:co-chaperonin GroES (HSP10)